MLMQVFFAESSHGRRILRCAVDAAAQFSDSPLMVLVPCDSNADDILGTNNTAGKQVARVQSDMQSGIGLAPCVLPYFGAISDVPPATVVVSRTLGHQRQDFHVLDPANEGSLSVRSQGPILVPFSDGDTGLMVANIAFELAEQRRRTAGVPLETPEVILYHTTWSTPRALSDDALDHVCTAAVRVMLEMERLATERGIKYSVIVEKHDDVVQGVVEIAQQVNASLVVVARGARIHQGSYVQRLLQQSPIPMFVVADNTPLSGAPAADADVAAFREQRKHLVKQAQDRTRGASGARRGLGDRMPLLFSPMFAVGVGGVGYLIKAVAKIAVGVAIASPMVTGDGFHNLADLLQAAALALSVYIASRPPTVRYPWGRRNIEWFTQLGVGLMLFVAAGKFIFDCVLGGLSYWPAADAALRDLMPGLPHTEAVRLDGGLFPVVVAVTFLGFVSSVLVSRYQLAVGKRHRSASLIAGAEEMRSDGWIEFVTFAGIVIQRITGWHFLEYPLGILVSLVVLHTACKLASRGWRVLLQCSLGDDNESAIRLACAQVAGVEAVSKLKTFQSGDTAVVIVTVESLAEGQTLHYLEKAINQAIVKSLMTPDAAFKHADVHVTMSRPDARRHRIAFALIVRGETRLIAPSLSGATHLAVCDVEYGNPQRTKVQPIEGDPVHLLLDKRVTTVFSFDPTEAERAALTREAQARLDSSEYYDGRSADEDPAVVAVPQLRQSISCLPAVCGLVV